MNKVRISGFSSMLFGQVGVAELHGPSASASASPLLLRPFRLLGVSIANDEICSDTRGYTKEVGDAYRRFGMLIYKAAIGTVSEDEHIELERLAGETPVMLKKASNS